MSTACDVPLSLQRCWYFGIGDALVRPCFSNPDFTAAIGHDRTEDQPNTFVGSPEFRRLDDAVGGELRKKAVGDTCVPHHCSHVSLGFDFGQVFRHKDRNTGVLCIRFVLQHGTNTLSLSFMHPVLCSMTCMLCDSHVGCGL